ncbi:protein-lysine N-methyltransferase EEF2KMT [Cylas formicarius]|uniref:protein-lysine N-methyltransferase EEF2KMT n=1 Tax=Cylas formicarius TaxID=197179 RepID=UPI0029588D63|nr:protein-lysine N-methyltransferase EEF2KMT [Cylas formicarius]
MQKVVQSETILNIVKQFLTAIPLKQFVWIDQELSLQNQRELLNLTLNSSLILELPINVEYQKGFLKSLLKKLEDENVEILDDLYIAYGRLVSTPPQHEYFKHYLIGSVNNIISLKENINLISDGTTGLRTWQASLALSEWCLKNKLSLENKNILELGSGVGLTGLVLILKCFPKKVYFSDCHKAVLKALCDNINLNLLRNGSTFVVNSQLFENCLLDQIVGNYTEVRVLNLPWEEVDSEWCKKIGQLDYIVAADIVYDIELFKPLFRALVLLTKFCHVPELIFACTERNASTLKHFLEVINETFKIETLETPEQDNFISWDSSVVHIFKFTPY